MNFRKIAQLAKLYDNNHDFDAADALTQVLLKYAQENLPFDIKEGEDYNDPDTVLKYFVGFVFDMISRDKKISKAKIDRELDKKISDKIDVNSERYKNLPEETKSQLMGMKDQVLSELKNQTWYNELPEITETSQTSGPAPKNAADFISQYSSAAQKASEMVGYVIPPSIYLAMAAHESGWGSSGLATKGNNLFGIKSSKGPSITMTTREFNNGEHFEDAKFSVYNADNISKMSALSNYLLSSKVDGRLRYESAIEAGNRYKKSKQKSDLFNIVDEIFTSGYSTDSDEPNAIKSLLTDSRYNFTGYDDVV